MVGDLDEEPSGELCQFNILLQDVPNEKNYYKLIINCVNTFNSKEKRCVYEIEDPSFLIPMNRYDSSNNYYKGKNGYFTDELFEGEEKNLFITIEKPKGVYDHFYVQLISIPTREHLKKTKGTNNLRKLIQLALNAGQLEPNISQMDKSLQNIYKKYKLNKIKTPEKRP